MRLRCNPDFSNASLYATAICRTDRHVKHTNYPHGVGDGGVSGDGARVYRGIGAGSDHMKIAEGKMEQTQFQCDSSNKTEGKLSETRSFIATKFMEI